MIRITKEEFDKVLKVMHEIGIGYKGFGGAIGGCYSFWIGKEKFAHHQFEYEEYYEMDEKYFNKYIQIANMIDYKPTIIGVKL